MDPRLQPLSDLYAALPGVAGRIRSLRGMLDDVAEIQWRHPLWWVLVGGTAVFERYGAPVSFDEPWVMARSVDRGARTDTFMGRERSPTAGDAPARIARAVVRARAAIEALAAIHSTLPEQPLHCHIHRTGGWLERCALTDTRRVAFLTDAGVFLGRISPGCEPELAARLARAELPRVDANSSLPTQAAVAVSLIDAPLAHARHVHRQTWSRTGGPWLGVAGAPPYEVTSTCHLVLDGHGHGLVSAELFRRIDALAPLEQDLARDLARTWAITEVPASLPVHHTHRWREAQPMGVASAVLPGRIPFDQAAYAFGRTMVRVYMSPSERRDARHSPTFMVPIAPKNADNDPGRRRRRVLYGLMSLRMQSGEYEPLDIFGARLGLMVDRVMNGRDILIRFMQAAVRIPTPRAMKRRYLGGYAQPNRYSPANLVLAGRGVLSCMRFTGDKFLDQPIIAASAPSLDIAAHDPRGSAILTLVQQPGFTTATLTGTGLAATHAGARRILDTWLQELASSTH